MNDFMCNNKPFENDKYTFALDCLKIIEKDIKRFIIVYIFFIIVDTHDSLIEFFGGKMNVEIFLFVDSDDIISEGKVFQKFIHYNESINKDELH